MLSSISQDSIVKCSLVHISFVTIKLGHFQHSGVECRASARLPAFLSTMPHIPSSLEGTRSRKALNGYRSLNVANNFGRIQDSHCWVCLSQSKAFPPLSLGCSDVAREHDITLHIKGGCMHTLEALGSWHLVSVLETESPVVDWKVGLFQDLAAASNGKNAF